MSATTGTPATATTTTTTAGATTQHRGTGTGGTDPHGLDHWRTLPARHQPAWDDAALADVVSTLSVLPPLVFAGEADLLRTRLAEAAAGRAFVLQAGDCAETFAGATADNVRNKLRVLLQMAVVLTYAASVPVVKLGRLAGQYATMRAAHDLDDATLARLAEMSFAASQAPSDVVAAAQRDIAAWLA